MFIPDDLPNDVDLINEDVIDDGNELQVVNPVHVNGEEQRRNIINLYFQ